MLHFNFCQQRKGHCVVLCFHGNTEVHSVSDAKQELTKTLRTRAILVSSKTRKDGGKMECVQRERKVLCGREEDLRELEDKAPHPWSRSLRQRGVAGFNAPSRSGMQDASDAAFSLCFETNGERKCPSISPSRFSPKIASCPPPKQSCLTCCVHVHGNSS